MDSFNEDHSLFRRCAELIAQADGLLITAGAGMGVDSGLPDFRGSEGFWGAYPALARARISFEQIASPVAFGTHPRQAWGFYGHRLNLYRATAPHEGFDILRRIGACLPKGYFVFTSNVDGQFQKAGFDPARVSECHGSIHHLQCLSACCDSIWSADDFHPEVDEAKCLLRSDFPSCPYCRNLARPNVLMFGDWGWLDARSDLQHRNLQNWLRIVDRPVIIEIGAGTRIPTVRRLGESVAGPLIRINPSEPQLGSSKGVSIAHGGLDAMRRIEAALNEYAEEPGAPKGVDKACW